jgi:ABC-2 type transport system permease protein
MTAFLALVRREYIEHRGAMLYAPLAMVALVTLFVASGMVMGRFQDLFVELIREMQGTEANPQIAETLSLGALTFYAGRVVEVGMLGIGFAWWLYLAGLVFFYTADAFSADRKNNAMLFWKSMPVSDLTMILSKFVTATVLIPVLIYLVMILASALFVGGFAILVRQFISPEIVFLDWLPRFGQMSVTLAASVVVLTLWYLPAVAWVGALSVVVGRWSIPLSILLPATLALTENIFVRIQLDGGFVWKFLSWRLQVPKLEEGYGLAWFASDEPFDAGLFILDLFGRLDWTQIGIGIAFTAIVLVLASEYRRRFIIT